MQCPACQETNGEVDLGCAHFYCRVCLEKLEGKCREGCEPIVQMPIQDARELARLADVELRTAELKTLAIIAKLEAEFESIVSKFRVQIDACQVEAKKAEAYVEALEIRLRSPIRTFPVKEYAKVHLESKCKPKIEEIEFFIDVKQSLRGPPKVSIYGVRNNYKRDSLVVEVPLLNALKLSIVNIKFLKLYVVTKNKTMIALRVQEHHYAIIVLNIMYQTVTEVNIAEPENALLFFEGEKLTSCPIPEGFKRAAYNLAVGPHQDSNKFELFDPTVGKPELVIMNVCGYRPRFSYNEPSQNITKYRARLLSGSCELVLPYLS